MGVNRFFVDCVDFWYAIYLTHHVFSGLHQTKVASEKGTVTNPGPKVQTNKRQVLRTRSYVENILKCTQISVMSIFAIAIQS